MKTETLAEKTARLRAQREASKRPISKEEWERAQAEWEAQGIGLTALERQIIGHLIP